MTFGSGKSTLSSGPVICKRSSDANPIWTIDSTAFTNEIARVINGNGQTAELPYSANNEPFTITLTGYIVYGENAATKMLKDLKIAVTPCPCCQQTASPDAGAPAAPLPPSGPNVTPDPGTIQGSSPGK